MSEPSLSVSGWTYLYCCVHTPAFTALPKPLTAQTMGGGNNALRLIEWEDLGIVVSDSFKPRYSLTRENLLTHELVLEEILRSITILPLRFNLQAKNEEEIREILRSNAHELRQALTYLEGRQEVGLKVFADQERRFAEIVEQYESIRQLRDALWGKSPQQTHYQRIELGKMVEEALQSQREADAQMIQEALHPLIVEMKEGKLLTDMMILNLACLIDKDREPAFEAAVEALDAAQAGRLTFKYVNLVPAYNFVNLVISRRN